MEQDELLLEEMENIKGQISDILEDTGSIAIRTEHGTFYKTIKKRWIPLDWDLLKHFCIKYADIGGMSLLENRLHQHNIASFFEEHPEISIPGIASETITDITVRKNV